ncbi:hypothetical protein R6Q57_013573 [Mikania cordata]
MGRSPCCEKNGLKKGPWTAEEDQKLVDYIQKNGYGNWRTLPKNAGLQRCGKSCRLRWTNYLRPDIKRGRFSFEEEETIIQLHRVLGNKWSAIAARLPGRTDNEIKNYWNTHIRKRLIRMGLDPVTHNPRLDLLDISTILSSSFYNSPHTNMFGVQPSVYPEVLRLAASLLSSQHNQNPNLINQSEQANQFGDSHQVQNHLVQPQNKDCQTLICSCALNEPNCIPFSTSESTQLMEPHVDQLPSSVSRFDQETCHVNDWQNNLDNFIAMDNYGYQQHIIDPQSNLTSSDFDFTSHLSNISTRSSSPTSLNSNSTSYINGSSIEDDREISYCSNLFKYEYQDILDSNVFM